MVVVTGQSLGRYSIDVRIKHKTNLKNGYGNLSRDPVGITVGALDELAHEDEDEVSEDGTAICKI